MPADTPQNIDNAFLEESWGMMQDLLEQEMPTTPKSQPSGKNWLTGILVLLFAWTTYLYWPEPPVNQKSDDKQEEAQKENSPLAATISKEQTLKQNEFYPTTTTLKNTAGAEALTTAHEGNLQNEITTAIKTTVRESIPTPGIIPAKAKNENLKKSEVQEFILAIEKEELEEKNTPVKRGEIISTEKLAWSTFASLPTKDRFNINELDQSAAFPVAYMESRRKPLKVAMRYEAIFDRRLLSGKYYGIEVTKGLNEHFTLAAGLGYSSYLKLNDAENTFERLKTFFNMEPSSGTDEEALNNGLPLVYDDSEDKYAVIGIEEMNYVTLPVELIFAVNSKASVVAGVGVSYLMNAKFNQVTTVNEWVSHEDGTVINEENDLLGTAIQRFDISTSIGFSFRAMDKIRLDLKFRTGLLDISKDDFLGFKLPHTNKYLHIGIAYDIFKL